MTFEFEGRAVILLEHIPGETSSRLLGTEMNLGVSANVDKTKYLDDTGLPTVQGSKILTDIFVQGLLANIHNADQRKFRTGAEHIRYIINELQRGFVAIVQAGEGEFTETDITDNHVVLVNFNANRFNAKKFLTGNEIYKILCVDSEKHKLFIEFAGNDILVVDDGTKIELWNGATLYTVHKIITSA